MRNPHYDHARLGLIALVVFGHAIEGLLDHPLARTLYLAVYAFHIPAFALLSGVLAPERIDLAGLRRIAIGVLSPYAFFQGLYLWAAGKPLGFVVPYWLLWYLVSLSCWRLMLPLFAHLRGALIWAVALALVAGMLSDVGYAFALSRTLDFFPLFLLGHALRGSKWLQRPSSTAARLTAGAGFALLLCVCWYGGAHFDHRWLYGTNGYAEIGVGRLEGMGLRLAVLAVSAALSLAFLTLVPRAPSPLAPLGARSLNAYLLHGFLIRFGAPSIAALWGLCGGWSLALLAVGAVAVTTVLSSGWVAWCVRPLTRPTWIERLLWRGPA
jgi:fucose 4-O-acetylase-like acetyltransferase